MDIPKSMGVWLPLLALGQTGCGMMSHEQKKPLNIIYIMTDDHSYQTMSCYDGRYNQTPNLDRLANEGLKFTNSFVSNSISGPSRAVLLTGKHSHKNGFMRNDGQAFDGTQQTFPKLLQGAGYQTAIIGKWHLGGTPTGFDHWDILPGQGSYYNPDFITPAGNRHHEGYVTNIITDKGIDYLEKRDKDKPFCLLLHHKAVHRIWMSDIPHLHWYEEVNFPLPETFWDDYTGRRAAAAQEMSIDKDMDLVYDLKMLDPGIDSRLKQAYIHGEIARMTPQQRAEWDAVYGPLTQQFLADSLTGKELAEWKYQRYMRDYLKSVQSLDENIGRLLDYLKKEGLLENTLIVYTSDQGFYMGEHGWFDKRFMYEQSLRTPLLVRLPDSWDDKQIKRGREVPELVQNIDHAPTFLSLAGVKVPEDIQGVSLLPLFQNEKEVRKKNGWRTGLYYHYYEYPGEHAVRKHYGVRGERFKLIRFYGDDIETWEMYDTQRDPDELQNLYGDERYAKVQLMMHQQLKDLQKQYDDPVVEM